MSRRNILSLPCELVIEKCIFILDHGEREAFGYSMDFIQDNFGTPWLFVGAPKDYDANLRNKSGTVNACPLNDLRGDLKCSVRFPQLQNANENEIFDDQLLGVTVTTAEQVRKQSCSNFANIFS